MAKKRHIDPIESPGHEVRDDGRVIRSDVDPLGIAVGLLAGLLVYVSYVPSDSVAVENGNALWVTLLSLVIAAITLTFDRPEHADPKFDLFGLAIDVLPWIIAMWVMVGAFQLSPPGNLRMSTNEGWLWIAGAAVFTAARRLLAPVAVRRAMLVLMIGCASGLAVHGIHQHFVSLPRDRARYQQAPDAVLQEAGFDAPEGSALRMVFENRLNDGGATATFSLANALAAVLLVGVVGAFGAMRFGLWKRIEFPRGAGFIAASIMGASLCGVGLLTTASRSALLATLLSIATLEVVARLGRSIRALLGIAIAATVMLILIASLGNAEWFEQAPASVAFRFGYWRSTAQLVFQNPWFGAGPGNFQSAYEGFRADEAHEQIADPHNLFFETLASGGIVAAIALLVLMGMVAMVAVKRIVGNSNHELTELPYSAMRSKWVWLGAALALVVVWLLSLVIGTLPDIQAHLFAVPVAIAIVVFAWPSMQKLSSSAVDAIASACLFGLTLHLMASGGWTVPGVAIYVWLFSAMLSRAADHGVADPAEAAASNLRVSIAGAALMVALIGCLYFVSIIPIQQCRSAIVAANAAGSEGRLPAMQKHLDEAITLDPWAVEAMMQKADMLRWALVVDKPNLSRRASWEASVEATKRRAGDNPTVFEGLGQQQLHLYQRRGDRRDLQAAHETFQAATRWSRADERLYAQLALIQMELGDRDAARKSAHRANELAMAGGIYERILAKQLVAKVKHVGKLAERELQVGFASELLGDLLTDEGSVAKQAKQAKQEEGT